MGCKRGTSQGVRPLSVLQQNLEKQLSSESTSRCDLALDACCACFDIEARNPKALDILRRPALALTEILNLFVRLPTMCGAGPAVAACTARNCIRNLTARRSPEIPACPPERARTQLLPWLKPSSI
mmetsp:Transcript_58541/g.104089  ORF Transcript_58541/g.104089 Transcript_58541/m.104089 type:complete len:126 (+) Transcript_58541:330-707(+)